MSRLQRLSLRVAYPAGPAGILSPFALGLSLLCLLAVGSCDRGTPAELQLTQGAQVGNITISGHVLDANGLGLANVTMNLAGSSQATRTTDSQGAYAFTSLASGSYSVRPVLTGCTFNPDVVNLNGLAASTVRDFSGAGGSCGGTGNVNAGATSGALTISGTVTDGAGNRVVGGQVTLGGNATAVRFTDQSGKYAFHVAAGYYTLTASGACGLTPAATNFTISSNRTQNFTGAVAATCLTARPASSSPTGQYLTVYQGTQLIGTTIVRVEARASVADALAALQAISQETSTAVRSVTIAGNPAIERQVEVPTPEIELPGVPEIESSIGLTTAIAVGPSLVRLESRVPDGTSAATINAFFLAGRNFQPENVSSFVSGPRPTFTTSRPVTPAGPPAQVQFAPTEVGLMGAEVQVAASETATSFVVSPANPNALSYSKDDGATLQFSTWSKTTFPAGATAFISRGDTGVAVGSYNGATSPYYYTELVQVVDGSSVKLPVLALGLWKSVDDGQTFNFAPTAYPLNCNTSGTCVVPDQPQIAVDTHNRANNNDQIYLAWRNAAPLSNSTTIALACSADGGLNWTFDYSTLGTKQEDYPRLTVADDGSLFVAHVVPVVVGSDTQIGVRVQKFSSCAQGFAVPAAPSAYPINVVTYPAPAVIPGLPRQPGANYTVAAAADASKLLYISYAIPSGTGNDDVHVAQWSETSKTMVKDQVVNLVGTGRRYFPSVCATGSSAFVAWYDRRAGDDKTAYFRRSILNDGAALGHEYNFTGTGHEDPECLAGFPGGGVGRPDAELLCTDLPTNNSLKTGTCQLPQPCPTGQRVCGSQTPCDFRPGAVGGGCTVVNESCQVPFNGGIAPGAPTFGDYDQAACARGKMFVAWGATTAPKNSCTMTGDACAQNTDCCSNLCESGICHSVPGACTPNGGACAQNTDCCNGILDGASVCQGGICFRRVGVFTASGGKATIVHIVGTETADITDNMGAITHYSQNFDQTTTLGLDGRRSGFVDTLVTPAGGTARAIFQLAPNDVDVVIMEEGESFGPSSTAFAYTPPLMVIHPGETNVFANGLSTAFSPQYAPYVGGVFSFSFNITTSQEP